MDTSHTLWRMRLLMTVCVIAAPILFSASAFAVPLQASQPSSQISNDQKQQPQPANAEATANAPEEVPEDELAPAAVQLDVSKASPLIQELYAATRETKEAPILAHLAQAKKLVENGADLKATDSQGRTALHWAIFGSSYNTKPKTVVAYEEIADAMLARGIDINRQDMYQDTALDYLLYSPNFEMQTLLIEHGATSGFLAGFSSPLDEVSEGSHESRMRAISMSRKTDLMPGATLSVRLNVPVYSDRSRTGDPFEATVTYPLCRDGEQMACREGELLVPPRTKVNGTILFAQKAPDKYSQPRLVLDFSNIVHKNGQRSPLYARVIDVDNARETVRNNEILGIIQPHASKKVSIAVAAVSMANPLVGYTIKGIQTVYGLSIRREILFPAGTDIQIQVVRPSMLKQKLSWSGWPPLPVTPELEQLVQSAPVRTSARNNTPSDLTNLMFLGTQSQLITAFGEAGWIEADDLGVSSALKTAQATVRQTGYGSGPVSLLLLQGRQPDLVFQKSLNTFAKRHHIRIWKLDKTYNGREVWIGAATHDIATSSGRGYTKWSHRIDPHVDRERDWVETDLLFIGTATAYADVDRPAAPRRTSNATGDVILTDGKMSVVELASAKQPRDRPLSAQMSK